MGLCEGTGKAAARGGVAVGLLTLLLMLATEPRLALAWDEGYTLFRLERVRAWMRAVRDPGTFAASWDPRPLMSPIVDRERPPSAGRIDTRGKLFEPRVFGWFWPFAREEPHGHPPFYALLALLGDVLTPWRGELSRARLGAILLFAATAGALFAFLARCRGGWSATLGAGAFALSPQLFGLGHYAHYDGPLACLWVVATLAFARAAIPEGEGERPRPRTRRGWAIAFGLACGAAAATKLTGWFVPLPFLIWTALHRDRAGAATLAQAAPVAVLALFALTPPWWVDPLGGLGRFFASNLTRGRTNAVPSVFLGRLYLTPVDSLPWYNTLVWTLAATPLGFLAWALAGAVRAVRARGDRLATLALIAWVVPLVLRALPHTPGHDGVRQLLPAFGASALVAGLGVGARPGRWARALVVAALLEGGASVAVMMPVPLSYFSPIVGGLPGAARLGFEPTYYWDTLTPEVLDRINRRTAPGRQVVLQGEPFSAHYLARRGLLRPGIGEFAREAPWQWYLVQNRTGMLTPLDRALIDRFGPRRCLLRKLGVPLAWAFSHEEVERLDAEVNPREDGR